MMSTMKCGEVPSTGLTKRHTADEEWWMDYVHPRIM